MARLLIDDKLIINMISYYLLINGMQITIIIKKSFNIKK